MGGNVCIRSVATNLPFVCKYLTMRLFSLLRELNLLGRVQRVYMPLDTPYRCPNIYLQ